MEISRESFDQGEGSGNNSESINSEAPIKLKTMTKSRDKTGRESEEIHPEAPEKNTMEISRESFNQGEESESES